MSMISLALVGVTDPRHRWFTAAAERRRAGVRVVGFSEADDEERASFELRTGVAGFADHRSMLRATAPDLIAIAGGSDPVAVALETIRAGADVLLTPPVSISPTALDFLLDAARSSGRRVVPVHTYRSHPASRLAKELLVSGRLGRLELVCLILPAAVVGESAAEVVVEVLDLFGWLTDEYAELVTRADQADPTDSDFGELIMVVEPSDTTEVAIEIRRSGESTAPVLQVVGERGAVEWDVQTGSFRSAVEDNPPVTVQAGRPAGQPDWVLNHLIRAARAEPTTADPWQATRIVASELGRFAWASAISGR